MPTYNGFRTDSPSPFPTVFVLDFAPLHATPPLIPTTLFLRGRASRLEAEDDRLLLGLRILDTYIRYPLPEDRLAIPVNYCAAQIFAPAWFDPLFTALRC